MEQTADPTVAYAIWAALMLVGGIAWSMGLRAAGRTFGEGGVGPSRGMAEVPMPPEALCKEIARRLTEQAFGLSVRLEACDPHQVRAQLFTYAGSEAAVASRPDRGATLRVAIEPDGSGSRLRWVVDGRPLVQLFGTAMKVVLVLGLCGLVAAGVLMPALVIPSEEPAVRWQVVQTIHVLHFLWPPFLIAFVARRRRALVETRTADLLNNLRFL